MTTTTQTVRQNGQAGFTLLELLLVIGVAALLLIGGIATYRLVSDGNRATEATRLLLTLRQEAQQLAQQSGGTYAGIVYDTATDDTDNVFVASGVLRNLQNNPFNGAITIAPNANPAELDITFANVPRSACVKMFTAIVNPNEITQVAAGATGGNVELSNNAGVNDLTAVNAAPACENTNQMTWTVK